MKFGEMRYSALVKYDFILFENYHQATNHKFDLFLIAKLLKSKGLKVAVLDVYHEDKEDECEGIEILHLKEIMPIPNDKWQLHPKNKLFSLLCLMRFLWQQHFYMKRVLAEIEGMADRFYCGSYHLEMSRVFMNSPKECYYWGLRSSRMTNFWFHFKKNPIIALRMVMLRRAFMRNPSQRLFVSNDIILNEFEKLGISKTRMLIREERCIDALGEPNYNQLSPNFSFLTIGMLRKDKRIDFTISEFLKTNQPDWKYVLAGKANEEYEKLIEQSMGNNGNIRRINEFLDYDDFNLLMRESHFVVLADVKQISCVTNGTMMEALINYRPIIAPNYDPYKSYFEKFGIGISYNPDVPGDLARAMTEAGEKGCESFRMNIEKFLHTLVFNNVASELYQQLYP